MCLCKFLDPFFPTMIDLLDSVTADLESGHLDDPETVCSVALKTIPDDAWALRLMTLACAREERAHALEYLTRAQNPDLAHLHVEFAVAHRGVGPHGAAVSTTPRALVLRLNPSEPLSNACQRCFPWRQLLQSAGTPVRLKPSKDIDIAIEAGALTTLEHARCDRDRLRSLFRRRNDVSRSPLPRAQRARRRPKPRAQIFDARPRDSKTTSVHLRMFNASLNRCSSRKTTMTPISIEVPALRGSTVKSVLATLPLSATNVDHGPSRSV